MTLTQESKVIFVKSYFFAEANDLMERLQDKYDKAFKTGDPSKLAEFYEPKSMLIMSGAKPNVWYGREGIFLNILSS